MMSSTEEITLMLTPDSADPTDDRAEALTAALRKLVRYGLPLAPGLVDDVLLDLPGVRARATQPDDRASRLAAFDGLLRWCLARFDDESLTDAARAMFGLPPGMSGTTLTQRREIAAAACGHEVHHFRKRIEPRLLIVLAWALRRDSDEYALTRAVAPPLARPSARPRVPADPFAWEAAEHAELLSRLWSGVYLLRAELLGLARARSMRGEPAALVAAACTALRRYAELLALTGRYRAAYGEVLLHADTGLPPEGLVDLAGWTPRLDPTQRAALAGAADGAGTELAFLAAVPGEITAGWCEALTGFNPGSATGLAADLGTDPIRKK
ncbi:hypothetical protein ACI2K4_22025 [Micromonospora sp. NPDC050397]|uniref:hypothetical protein n=1 Tax=Micromonospora sp. NPDC050397 TaxID=3364279 RepID=UPI00384B08BC